MKKEKNAFTQEQIDVVTKILEEMQYGSVTLIVQDGKIVQIEKQEKYRLV